MDPSFRINKYVWKRENLEPINTQNLDSLEGIASDYKRLSDSINTIKELRNGYGEERSRFLEVGVESAVYNDTCGTKWYFDKAWLNDRYKSNYIVLYGWKLNVSSNDFESIDSGVFHVEKGKSYIRKLLVDDRAHLVAEKDVSVKFRYDKKVRALLIPIGKVTKKVLEVAIIVAAVLVGIVFLYLVAGFIKFLVDISKGLFFTDRNLMRLKLIAFSLLIFPVAVFILNLTMRLIFWSYFTADVKLNESIWQDSWKPIGLGLIFLALYRAFKQGKKLKEEQELTI